MNSEITAEKGKHGADTGHKGGQTWTDRDMLEIGFLRAIENAKEMVADKEGSYDDCLQAALVRDADLRTLIPKNSQVTYNAGSVLPRAHDRKIVKEFITMIMQTQRLPRRGSKWRKRK